MVTYNNITTRMCILLVIIIYLSFDFLFGTNYSHLHASIRATSLINMSIPTLRKVLDLGEAGKGV